MKRTRTFTAVWLVVLASGTWVTAQEREQDRLNILFIAVDDLRAELGCYGVENIQSPNIDRLAAHGTVFDRAYCQQAVCSPSRTSLLTGLRPDSTRVYNLTTHFRDTVPDVVTLPQHFKDHGYFTRGVGKIYHGGLDDSASWSEPPPRVGRPMYATEENKALVARKRAAAQGKKFATPSARYNAMTGPSYECADVPGNTYSDGAIADAAIEMLREVKDQPFFLAVGFLKPHLPFIAPKKYWDLYDREGIPMAANPFPPIDAPRQALTNWGELRAYEDIPASGSLTDEKARQLTPQRAWKQAAFSQYPRGSGVMGYSMRTDRYRLTRWLRRDGSQHACELYDHQDDPQEDVNVAGRLENAALVQQLTKQMQAGWKAARNSITVP